MRFAKLAAALLLAFCALAAPAFGEVAVVDVARVIERSVPGKEGQQYIDNLRKSLNDELAAFAKSASVVLSYYRLKASAGCAGRGLQKQKKRKDRSA